MVYWQAPGIPVTSVSWGGVTTKSRVSAHCYNNVMGCHVAHITSTDTLLFTTQQMLSSSSLLKTTKPLPLGSSYVLLVSAGWWLMLSESRIWHCSDRNLHKSGICTKYLSSNISNLSRNCLGLVSQIQLNFIFADKSVFSPLCSQLFSQDLSRSCNILPLVNITRSCNPVIIQPLTRHSQDLNIIQSPCFLPSHWPPSHLRASDWLMRTDVTSLTLWQLSPVTSRSQSQTMNTPGTRQRSRLRRGALLWQMTNKMDIKDVIFVHLLRRDDDQYSCLSSVACNHFPVIESP